MPFIRFIAIAVIQIWSVGGIVAQAVLTDPNAKSDHGNSALHWACLNSDADLVSNLISHNAEVNALNEVQASPLLYAAGNLEIVRLLVRNGADVNHASKFKSTPLIVAARHPRSHAVIEFLIANGADPKVKDGAGSTLLDIAAQVGDEDSVKLLINAGLKPNDLSGAAMYGHHEIVERLLEAGAGINQKPRFAGHALNYALYGQNSKTAKLLVERGADLNLRSPVGQHETPPILWAAYNEHFDSSVAKAMIKYGADVNQLSAMGESAVDWARERKNRSLVRLLEGLGASSGNKVQKHKPIPNNPLPDTQEVLNSMMREAAAKAIKLLQKSSDGYLLSPLVKKQRCVSCHHQTLPAIAFGWAKERGISVDDLSVARQVQDQIKFWSRSEKIAKSFELIRPQPDAPVLLGYGLLGLSALDYPGDALTNAMVRYLLATQKPDGSWPAADYRPPIEDGPIQGAALAIGSLKRYPIKGRAEALESALTRAREYLKHASPRSFNQQVSQVLGLSWSGQSAQQLKSKIDALTKLQQTDGGWAPLQGLASDAWATGQALVALLIASDTSTHTEVIQSGLRFLLRTQFPDGSWYVKSRSWPFQPHFESGFPHGKDQWISAGATAWATMALLQTQPRIGNTSITDWMAIKVPINESVDERKIELASTKAATTSFQTDIQPFLERSCGACHGAQAKKKKGSFSILDRAAFLIGGQSNKPVVVAGDSKASDLILMITDQIEDLEMPPLSKRELHPPLNKDEVVLLKTWINEGLPN
ncbi:MAG: hypothetical protein HOI66_13990 [Verrucomicrobia bacterium]|nr:hypothetical protein [Verrucomicrobiota bacterium]